MHNGMRIIGYRKSGQPIYLARGGAKRRTSDDIATEIERHRGVVIEVADMEDPSDQDLERQQAALVAMTPLEVERAAAIEREDEIQRVRDLALDADEDSAEPGDGRDTPAIQRRRQNGPAIHVKGDEFEILRSDSNKHMDKRQFTGTLRDSIMRASENFDMPEGYEGSLEKYVKRHQRDASWAKNILGRMRPEYLDAFEKVMTGTEVAFLSDVERAAFAVGTNTAGGYLVPTHLDPTLILTNNGVSNVARTMGARQVTLTGGANKWNGVTTAGATASWDAELTEVSDDTPPVAPAQIPVYSAKALIMASIESFEDITGLASDVQMLLADARDRLEAVAHMTGSGTGQPTGLFTSLVSNTNVIVKLNAVTSADHLTLADLQNVRRQLPVRWRGNAKWLMNPLFLGYIQALGTALSASYSTDITSDYTDRLIGRPVIETDEAPSVQQTTTNDPILVFGDLSNFVIVDKPGSTSIEFIPHLFNTSNNLPDGRRGWYMHFRNGADSVNDLAFRVLTDQTTA